MIFAFAAAAFTLAAILVSLFDATPGPPAPTASIDSATDETAPSDSPSPSPVSRSTGGLAVVAPIEPLSVGRHAMTAEGVPISLRVPTKGWWRYGDLYISKSWGGTSLGGRNDAEAIIFWTDVDKGDYAKACGQWWGSPDGSTADWASSAARAQGTELVRRSNVVLGGSAANHVVLTVREDVGCNPGFFHTWRRDLARGPVWTSTAVGDTIRIWLVRVGGKLLYIEADTHRHAGSLRREIRRIIRSIRFDSSSPTSDPNVSVADRFLKARNVHNVDDALALLDRDRVRVRLMYDDGMASDVGTVELNRHKLRLALEAERLLGTRYDALHCQGEPSPGHTYVRCSYSMKNRLRRIQGLAPVRSWFLLGLRNHLIDLLSFPWLSISYNPGGLYPAEAESFIRWLQAEHAEAVGVPELGAVGALEPGTLLRRGRGQEMILRLTRASLVLLHDYLDEYEASMSA
jgi:hypothetical protein